MRVADIPVSHAKYTGSEDAQGYPTADAFDTPVPRLVYAVYPRAGRGTAGDADHERRVVTSKVLLTPDVSVYSARDKVVLPDGEYFVSSDVMDYSTGPFDFKPSPDATAFGEVAVEKVTG